MAGRPRTPRRGRVSVAAFLRVYEPLDVAVSERASRRQHTGARAVSADTALITDAAELAALEYVAAVRAATAVPPRPVADVDLGPSAAACAPAVRLSPPAADGITRACPADLTRRALMAIEVLRLGAAPEVMSAFLPASAVAEAGRRLDAEAGREQSAPHVLCAAWHIPTAWFTLFDPAGRVSEADDADDADDADGAAAGLDADADLDDVGARGGASAGIRYHAAMADARRNLARALAATRALAAGATGSHPPARVARVRAPLDADSLEELGRWLEDFHPRSVVELDYAGLALLTPAAENVDATSSVALVSAAVALARAGSVDDAARSLRAVADRWIAVRAFGRAS